MSPFFAFLIGLGIGPLGLILLQAWRAKSQATSTIGPVVQAVAAGFSNPLVTDLATWAEATARQGAHNALDAALAALQAKKASIPEVAADLAKKIAMPPAGV